jgi:hypothetical protein
VSAIIDDARFFAICNPKLRYLDIARADVDIVSATVLRGDSTLFSGSSDYDLRASIRILSVPVVMVTVMRSQEYSETTHGSSYL